MLPLSDSIFQAPLILERNVMFCKMLVKRKQGAKEMFPIEGRSDAQVVRVSTTGEGQLRGKPIWLLTSLSASRVRWFQVGANSLTRCSSAM